MISLRRSGARMGARALAVQLVHTVAVCRRQASVDELVNDLGGLWRHRNESPLTPKAAGCAPGSIEVFTISRLQLWISSYIFHSREFQ